MLKLLAGILGGLMLAILGAIVVTTMFAGGGSGAGMGALSFFAFWAIGMAVALTAPVAAKAWRRLLISSAVISFLLPLSGLIYTGSFLATMDSSGEHSGAATAGAVIGGGLVSGFLGFVGFFLGIALLVVGLLVGRDKQVVYVQASPTSPEAK